MAKSKKKTQKRELRLTVADKDLSGVALGQATTVTVSGKVTALRTGETMEYFCCDDSSKETEHRPAVLELDVASVEIVQGGNDYTKMANEDLAETDEG